MKEKIHYPVYTFRLSVKTLKRLRKRRIEEGVSWNKLFMRLLDE